MSNRIRTVFSGVFLIGFLSLSAQAEPVSFVNCTVYTMTSQGVITDGYIQIADGEIAAVSDRVPAEKEQGEIIDLGGGYVLPGLIDAHSGLGLHRSRIPDEYPGSVLEYFSPQNSDILTALHAGITTVALRPPADSLFSGYSALVHLLPDSLGGPVVVVDTLDLQISLSGPFRPPSTKHHNLPGEILKRSYRFRNAIREVSSSGPPSAASGRINPVIHAVEHNIPLYILVESAVNFLQVDESLQSLQHHRYYGRLHHIMEAFEMAGEEETSGDIPHLVLGPGLFAIESESNRYYSIPSRLTEIGIEYTIGTFHPVAEQLSLLDKIRKLPQYGISESQAIAAITANPGRSLLPRSRLGTIEKGAPANLVVFNLSPLDVRSKVTLTIVNGHLLWNTTK